jgi:hypothetical protein
MKRLAWLLTACALVFPAASAAGQTAAKLTGTVIGTTDCFDYAANRPSATVNTAANLFDSDFSTFFATNQRDEGWAGLDLGSKHIITTVKYSPRITQADRVRLGVFEGANLPDFGDAIPLHVIPSAGVENQLTAATVQSSKGFRYVRYIGRRDVRCNIAELEFWGYEGEGDNTHVGQVTNLPTVSIHTTGNAVVNSREDYIKGIVSVIDGDYFHTDSLDIRGRGNASWGFPKKPYRMKLFNKTNLLGNPAKEKNWTLINNYGDKTLMRNLIAFDISQRMDMIYTPAARPVDVVLNGEYVGTYQLCDQIEVAEGRVSVDKMKETDIALPNLSGGYMLEIDGYAYGSPWDPDSQPEPVKFTSPLKSVPVTVKYPKDDEIVDAQFNYIENYFTSMEASLFRADYTDPANGFRKYLDVPTLIRYFLIGQITGNPDIFWSIYLTKKRNDDKFYFGPIWDFDIAFENDVRVYPTNDRADWLLGGAGNVADYMTRCLSDPAFYNELKSVYAAYRNSGKLNADTLLKVVDNYAAEMNASQQLNFSRWNILNQIVHQNWGAQGSYAGEINVLKVFITSRIAWMDNKLKYTPATAFPTTNAERNDAIISSQNALLRIHNLTENTHITCLDPSGRIIFKTLANNQLERQLPRGLYIFKFENNTGSYALKHVVK